MSTKDHHEKNIHIDNDDILFLFLKWMGNK